MGDPAERWRSLAYYGARDVNFGCVPADWWHWVRDLLLPAINRAGEYTEEQVREQLATKDAQLWVAVEDVIELAVVTRISVRARGSVCEIWLLGGKSPDRWMHFLDVIEQAARERGCAGMEVVGRAGWERMLPDYRRTAVVLKKVFA